MLTVFVYSAFTGGDGQSLNGLHNHVGLDRHSQVVDPHYVQYLGRSSDYATRDVASGRDPSNVRKYLRASHGDLEGLQKAYIEALLAQQQQQYELQLLGKSVDLNHGYYASHPYGLGIPYPGNLMANPVVPSVGSGCFQNEQNLCFSPMMRSSVGGHVSWQSDAANNMGVKYTSSLLDEFKTNKTRSFELSDIVDHVVEFRYIYNAVLVVCMIWFGYCVIYFLYIIQYRPAWESLYSAETRSCHPGRKDQDIP